MNKKIVGLFLIAIAVSSIVSFSLGGLLVANTVYTLGVNDGTQQTLSGVAQMLKEQGIDIAWSHNQDGSYTVQCLKGGTMAYSTNIVFHAYADQYRNGKLIASSYHTMSVTNYGKDWVEQQLFSYTNTTQKALYLSTSNNTGAFDAAWLVLPGEYTVDGLARATGSYVSTGVGAANVSATFNVVATADTQLYGINADDYATHSNSLIAAEQQGAGAVKHFLNGDSLVLTVQWSHS